MSKLLPFLPLFDQTAIEQPSAPDLSAPPDADARKQALNIQQSFVVEAPAGSGKTGLLIQRFLKLLADESVTSPEQVLAITFTIKATAEMRDRVLDHLEAARRAPPTPPGSAASDFATQTRALAHAVLERDRELGWSILDHPHRLNIRTIDAVCAEIAKTLPILSGSGGRLSPSTDARALHREAARRTLLLLGGDDADFNQALRALLLHRDGNLTDCENLLTEMLALRDQWGEFIPLDLRQLDDDWLDANALPKLERALEHAVSTALAELSKGFPLDVLADLAQLASEMAPFYPTSPIAICGGRSSAPGTSGTDLEHWQSLIHLIVKPSKPKGWRKSLAKGSLRFEIEKHHQAQLKQIIARLAGLPNLVDSLCEIQKLPPAHYPADQWAVAKSLFRVLRRALIELQIVFAERNQCDFTEVSLLARHALNEDSGADDLAAALGARLQHLLVDEMQDTSTGQYDLLELLTESWDGHSQTVFLVGDPRQSIYLFRQARVERFIRAMETEKLGDLSLTKLSLTANFRSQPDLVDQFNADFPLIFPAPAEADTTRNIHALPYTAAAPTRPPSPHACGIIWHAHPLPYVPPAKSSSSANDAPTANDHRQLQDLRDAQQVLRIAREWFAKSLPEGRTKPWSMAVLVRGRNHLTEIVKALREAKAPIPFRAVEIESLGERQEILDLTALTRALLHPADRVAALAVLRAPWCGLTLADLHTLTGGDEPLLKDRSILSLMSERGHLLPEDSRRRMARIRTVLEYGIAQRGRLTTAQLVERAWRSLGSDTWLNPTQLTNTRRFFQLLDTLETESASARVNTVVLEERLRTLFAEPEAIPSGTAHIELLTIHTAKGLEWDVVCVPSLERGPGRSSPRLLTWAELDTSPEDEAAHVMLAPIAAKGGDVDALTSWLKGIYSNRELAEQKRLFYVACTRAREELHLFAAPSAKIGGEMNVVPYSLLKAAWPAAERWFAAVAARPAATVPTMSPQAVADDSVGLDIAASAGTSHKVQRVPASFDPTSRFTEARTRKLSYGEPETNSAASRTLFARPEGSFAARSFGNAVHACLEVFARRIAEGQTPASLLVELPSWSPRIAAILRADGLPRAAVDRLAREARFALEKALRDPDGLWLLAPHVAAASELALTSSTSASGESLAVHRLASVRADRIFHAGAEPHLPGNDFLWIVDYKTSAPRATELSQFFAEQRAAYAPQLETYARILAPARSMEPAQVRLALYFPSIPHLEWWKCDPST